MPEHMQNGKYYESITHKVEILVRDIRFQRESLSIGYDFDKKTFSKDTIIHCKSSSPYGCFQRAYIIQKYHDVVEKVIDKTGENVLLSGPGKPWSEKFLQEFCREMKNKPADLILFLNDPKYIVTSGYILRRFIQTFDPGDVKKAEDATGLKAVDLSKEYNVAWPDKLTKAVAKNIFGRSDNNVI